VSIDNANPYSDFDSNSNSDVYPDPDIDADFSMHCS